MVVTAGAPVAPVVPPVAPVFPVVPPLVASLPLLHAAATIAKSATIPMIPIQRLFKAPSLFPVSVRPERSSDREG
jgi:hypothetical protein